MSKLRIYAHWSKPVTFWKTLISVQILLVIVTGCQTTNSNKSTSNNNINVSEIKNSLHEDGLGILKFEEPSPLISKTQKPQFQF